MAILEPPILSGRGLGRVFGSGDLAVRALHAADLEVRCGEVLVLMGPSGSGKTTLLSILGLVLRPSEGEVHLGERRVSTLAEEELAVLRRDSIGFVFQQINLVAGLSATDNVSLPLLLRGMDGRRRSDLAGEALRRVGLEGKETAKPRQLSGGQQQRVAIARALVTGAPVLLCDEPTASLDPESGHRVLDLLRRAARELGRGVVIVTHDERVLGYGDRLVEVVDGRVRPPRNLECQEEKHNEACDTD